MIDQLPAEERAALTRQGSVCIERRGERIYYKLRFRIGGRQRVRYIGSCAEEADRVRAELRVLQQPRRTGRQIRAHIKECRREAAAAKRQLTPLLEQVGYGFHGRSIRCRRRGMPQPSGALGPVSPPPDRATPDAAASDEAVPDGRQSGDGGAAKQLQQRVRF